MSGRPLDGGVRRQCGALAHWEQADDLLVRFELLIEELLNRLKQLHAVLFHDDGVRAFSDLYVSLVGCIG
jgi:hypothetical protein